MSENPVAGPAIEELALRLQEAEHGRIIRYVQVQAADDPYQHGQRWPKPFSNAFEDCQHPDCVLARTSAACLRAALREPGARYRVFLL